MKSKNVDICPRCKYNVDKKMKKKELEQICPNLEYAIEQFEIHRKMCCLCGESDNIKIHRIKHIDNNTLNWQGLIPLCTICYEIIHIDRYKINKEKKKRQRKKF